MFTKLGNFKISNTVALILAIAASLLTIVYTSIQIYSYFTAQREFIIEAKGEKNNFTLPSDVDRILLMYKEQRLYDPEFIATIPIQVKTDLEQLVKLRDYKTQWNFKITNKSNKEVKDLRLEFPWEGYYSLYSIDNVESSSNSGEFNRIIPIGNIRPTNSITLNIWSDDGYFFYDEYDQIKITYPEGFARISYPEKIEGLYAWLYNNQFNLLIYLYALCIIIYVIVYLILKFKTKHTRSSIKKVNERLLQRNRI